jgi:phosphate transport system protein
MERHHFEADLEALKHRLLHMGSLVETLANKALVALMERRAELARAVLEGDAAVNALQIEIDDRCLKMLALQQPMATDLRLITSAMKMGADLERIGDQAVNIAETALRLLETPPLKPVIDIADMADIAQKMTRDALDAFVRRDSALAREVLERDDRVDHLKDRVFRVLLTHMMADPGTIERALGLILISRNIERIADHATNIAEDVIFLVEARDVRHHHTAE